MSNLQERKKPKYLQLADDLRNRIMEGALTPGTQLPSFSEMLAQHGATPTTVERVYSLLAQEGLIVREHRRGVFVAEREPVIKTGTIGFLFGGSPDLRHRPYWNFLMQGIQEEADRQNMQILLINHVSSVQWEKIDGIIINETWEKVEDDVICEPWIGGTPRWLPPGMPCSAVLSQVDDIRSVIVDDYQSVRDVTRYLLSRGHRRIAYLSSLLDPISKRRVEGYQDALRTAGVRFEPSWLYRVHVDKTNLSHYKAGGHDSMQRWMHEGWAELGCTALVAQNDETAMGAITALQEAGISVPGDVSVVGFDGTGIDEYFSPRLTTVEVPLKQIGMTAMRLLTQQMAHEDNIPSTIMMPARIREGASVRTIEVEIS